MAARFVHAGAPADRGLAALLGLPRAASPGALVAAAALPLLFLHSHYQPSLSVGLAHTSLTAYLSDFAVLAIVLAGLAAAARGGLAPLAPGRALWFAFVLFFVWVAVEIAHGRSQAQSYAGSTHTVTALKFVEYALLAPALVLLLRRLGDVLALAWSLTLWSTAATVVGLAQFFGANVALAHHVGQREASFLGYSDFAALSAGVALLGIVGLALPRLRLGNGLAVTAAASGGLGTILAGSVASALGLVTALAGLGIVLAVRHETASRRLAWVGAVAAVVVFGTFAIRGNDLQAFARFVGASTEAGQARSAHVQTYSQRTLLVWFGYEMWKDNPLLGVGWQGSSEPANFEPYLPAAHRRFPDVAALAFPADKPGRRYGVQNVWVQALADLGVVGFALWLSVFASAAWLGLRATLRGASAAPLLGFAGTLLLAWLWTAQGFVAGIPLDALTSIVFGLSATRLVDT